MNWKRKKVFLGRHGIKNAEGQIVPHSLVRLQANGMRDLSGVALSPEQVSLRHSDHPRTRVTGLALAAGSIEGLPIFADPQKILKSTRLNGMAVLEDLDLSFEMDEANTDAYLEAEAGELNSGGDLLMEHNFRYPLARSHLGKMKAPYETFRRQLGIRTAQNTIRDVLGEGKTLAGAIGHATTIDPVFIALVDSGRTSPVKRLEDYGRSFGMEDYAVLSIDHSAKSGRITNAHLVRGDQEFPVNVRTLLNKKPKVIPYKETAS